MNKTYRCLTCGFALMVDANDKRSLGDINSFHHAIELSGVEDKTQCPACHGYLKKYGGRKNGKVEMPDITSAGSLVEETEEVRQQVEDLNKDFNELIDNRAQGKLTGLRSKHGSRKIFGYSVDDLLEWHDKNVK